MTASHTPSMQNEKRSGSETRWRSDLLFFLACFFFLYIHSFFLPAIPTFNEADHLNLLNDAKRIVAGEFIYRDYFEFVFPGSHTLYAFLIAIFGPRYWILNAVIIAHGMIAAVLGVLISRKVIADTAVAYLPSAIFLFFGFRWLGGDGEHRMLSPLFVYLAILVLLGGRSLSRVAIAAAACAFSSFFTQQRGLLAAAGIGLFLILEFGWVQRDWRRVFRSLLVLGSAFAGVLILLLTPYILLAGPQKFFESTIGFLATYISDPEFNAAATYFATLAKIKALGTPIFIVSVFYSVLIPGVYLVTLAFLALRRRTFTAGLPGILLVTLVGLFVSLGTSGMNASRLFHVALPAVIALTWLFFQTSLLKEWMAKAAIITLTAAGIALGVRLHFSPDAKVLDTSSGKIVFMSPLVAERYEWLMQHTSPGDFVYESYNSHVHFPLGLRNPSRISIMLNSGYSPPEHVAWVIEDLKRNRPRYIIWDGAWTEDTLRRPKGERLEPFYRFMTQNYRRVASFTPYEAREREIWELVNTAADTGAVTGPADR